MAADNKKSNNALAMTLLKGRTFIVLIILMIFFSITANNFLTVGSLLTVAKHVALYGILAIGMTYVIITGGIDLSVGSVVCFVAAVGGKMMVLNNMNPYLTMLVMLITGIAIGAWQGFWIAYVRIPPFIVTLAGMLAFRGLSNVVLQGQTLAPMPDSYLALFNNYIPDPFGKEGFNVT